MKSRIRSHLQDGMKCADLAWFIESQALEAQKGLKASPLFLCGPPIIGTLPGGLQLWPAPPPTLLHPMRQPIPFPTKFQGSGSSF